MKRTTKRLLCLLLSVMMLATMLPVSAFAAEPEDGPQVLDSGIPDGKGKHWLQEYQEYVLAQLENSGPRKAPRAGATNRPSYSLIHWASGEENRLKFANGAYTGSPMPKITLKGEVAFCGEWNGEFPSGDYIQTGEGNDPAIKQILANYHNSGQSNADYAAAQAAIWAHIMGTTIVSWGGCSGAASEDEILYGSCDYIDLRYDYLEWSGGTQNLITYHIEDIPFIPGDAPEKYRIEVKTDTSTETEVRNQKTYSYSDAIGQVTIRKHDQDEKSLDGALFDIDVAFSDGSHTTINGWEVDNGARLFTWTHPKDDHERPPSRFGRSRPPEATS